MNKLEFLKPEHLDGYQIKEIIKVKGFDYVKDLINEFGGEQLYIPAPDNIDPLKKDIILSLQDKNKYQIRRITNYPIRYINEVLKEFSRSKKLNN